MGKKFNSTFFITTILCFVPMILGIVLWDKLPSELPMNYGFNNEIRHLAPKWINVILLPIIFAVLNIIKSISMTEKDIERSAAFVSAAIPVRLRGRGEEPVRSRTGCHRPNG